MKSASSIFSIEDGDAAEFLQEDFELDFIDKGEPSKESSRVADIPVPQSGSLKFGKFTFKPARIVRTPEQTPEGITSNPKNGFQKFTPRLQLGSQSPTVHGKIQPGTGHSIPSNSSNDFQKFVPKVQMCSPVPNSEEYMRGAGSGSTPSKFVPMASDGRAQRATYLSSLANLHPSKHCKSDLDQSENNLPVSSKTSVSPSSMKGPVVFPQNEQLWNFKTANNDNDSTGSGVSSEGGNTSKQTTVDINRNVFNSANGFQKFQKSNSSQFLTHKRSRSSPSVTSLSSTKSDKHGPSNRTDPQTLLGSSFSASCAGRRSSSFFKPTVANDSLTKSSDPEQADDLGVSRFIKMTPPTVCVGATHHSGVAVSTGGSISASLETPEQVTPRKVLPQIREVSGSVNPSSKCAEGLRTHSPRLSSSGDNVENNPILSPTRSVDGETNNKTLPSAAQQRLRQIPGAQSSPGVPTSNQFQRKSSVNMVPIRTPSPVDSQFSQRSTLNLASSRLPNRPGNPSSPLPPRVGVSNRYASPSINTPRQPWTSPRSRAPFSGQRFTPGRPRTPQVSPGERFSSPRQPVLTPRVAQLCKTPTGPAASGQTRSSRKFPGPAGILPKLSPGQKLSSIKLSPPVDDEKQEKEKEVPVSSQGSQSGIDDFSHGAWATMKAELELDEEDPKSFLSQHTIASVLRKASMKQLHKNKVPQMCVMVKTITFQASDAVVTFRDPSGEMQGTIHRCLMEEYQSELKPGCVLLLRQVGVLSPSLRNHYLNVTHRNVLQIFPPEATLSQRSPTSQITPKGMSPKSVKVNFDEQAGQDRLVDEAEVPRTPSKQILKRLSPKCVEASQDKGLSKESLDNETNALTHKHAEAQQNGQKSRPTSSVAAVKHFNPERLGNSTSPEPGIRRKSSSDGVSPFEKSSKKRRSEEFIRDLGEKRVCLDGPVSHQKENVCPGGPGSEAVSPGAENIADLIDGFEEELLADF